MKKFMKPLAFLLTIVALVLNFGQVKGYTVVEETTEIISERPTIVTEYTEEIVDRKSSSAGIIAAAVVGLFFIGLVGAAVIVDPFSIWPTTVVHTPTYHSPSPLVLHSSARPTTIRKTIRVYDSVLPNSYRCTKVVKVF